MEQKNSKMLNDKIMQTVSAYCLANNIENVDEFIYKCFRQGFDIEKYGFLGKTVNEGEKDLIKEVIVEKQVEIPVEVIKEVTIEKIVEVIKEVPVDRVVEKVVEVVKEVPVEKVVIKEVLKEVPVDRVIEKEIYITDDKQVEELGESLAKKNEELDELRQEFSTKTAEMENIFQNEMSKKDKELDELRRNLDIPVDNSKLQMLQQTITNLNGEIRDLKTKNKELQNKLLEQPKESDFTRARFHGSSNLNDGLYK